MRYLLCCLLAGFATSALAESLDEIIAKHTAAMGGAAAIEAVSTIAIEIEIAEPSFQLTGQYVADRTGRMRIDVYSDGQRVYTEAYDGESAWQMDGDGVPAAAAADGTAALWHGTQFPGKLLGLHEMGDRYHRLAAEGRETVDGVAYHVLKLTYRDGFETWLYLDPETWLIARSRDLRALHPDMDPTTKWLENRYTDFRPVDGVMHAFAGSQVDLNDGATLQTTKVHWIRTNVPLDAELFRAGHLREARQSAGGGVRGYR